LHIVSEEANGKEGRLKNVENTPSEKINLNKTSLSPNGGGGPKKQKTRLIEGFWVPTHQGPPPFGALGGGGGEECWSVKR